MMVPDAWYAVQVRPRFERSVAWQLEQRGYEQFVPLYRVRRRWTDRVKAIDLPLFPSYVFCRMNAAARTPIVTTPGVIRVVGDGTRPIAIDAAEIAHVQKVAASALESGPWPGLAVGQRVRICEGPLQNVVGTITREANAQRLIVSITLLQRAVAVEIDRWRIEPVAP